MSGHCVPIGCKELERWLLERGFTHIRNSGGHRIYKGAAGQVSLPFHGTYLRETPFAVLRNIRRVVGEAPGLRSRKT